jgi:hypothetical protein
MDQPLPATDRLLPDFLGIGAQKAGTTWLYENFRLHPGIWMPPEKELHYFDEKVDRPRSLLSAMRSDAPWAERWRRQVRRQWRRYRANRGEVDVAWYRRYFLGHPSDDWYRSLFRPEPGQIAGEFTPDYAVLSESQVTRAAAMVPGARILFFMRNPIERAWSHAQMSLRKWGVTEDAATLAVHFARPRSLAHSDYLQTLRNWTAAFPSEQVYVGFLEDISFHPHELLASVYGFLGLDPGLSYRVVTRKIHQGSSETIPTAFAVELARIHYQDICDLAGRFGGYALIWQAIVDELLSRPPSTESIQYPFWESKLDSVDAYHEKSELLLSGPLGRV